MQLFVIAFFCCFAMASAFSPRMGAKVAVSKLVSEVTG